jgi:serine O-acetyltransferase
MNGAAVGKGCDIESPLILHNCNKDYRNLSIGDKCHIGKDVFLDLSAPIVIKDCTTISMRTLIISHLDVGNSPLKKCGWKRTEEACILERGCYLGAGVIVVHGVKLGECAFVGAGSVVIDHIPSWTMVAGVPAKRVRKLDATSE